MICSPLTTAMTCSVLVAGGPVDFVTAAARCTAAWLVLAYSLAAASGSKPIGGPLADCRQACLANRRRPIDRAGLARRAGLHGAWATACGPATRRMANADRDDDARRGQRPQPAVLPRGSELLRALSPPSGANRLGIRTVHGRGSFLHDRKLGHRGPA